jgi:hypothetical protein
LQCRQTEGWAESQTSQLGAEQGEQAPATSEKPVWQRRQPVESQKRHPGKEERQLEQLPPLRRYPERHCRQAEELQERQLGSKQSTQLFPLR